MWCGAWNQAALRVTSAAMSPLPKEMAGQLNICICWRPSGSMPEDICSCWREQVSAARYVLPFCPRFAQQKCFLRFVNLAGLPVILHAVALSS
jgi:hypothetical protein